LGPGWSFLCAAKTTHLAIAIERLHVTIPVKGTEQIAFVSEMAALPVSHLGTPVDSARDFRPKIIGAVDLLITGF